jgi:CRISPR-associated protein Cmr1
MLQRENFQASLDAFNDGSRPSRPLTLEITLQTPMVGGGTEPMNADPVVPFRGEAMRGALRFFWRIALVGGLIHKDLGIGPLDVGALRQLEKEVWGGVHGAQARVGLSNSTASSIGLTVSAVTLGPDGLQPWSRRSSAVREKLAYAYFPVAPRKPGPGDPNLVSVGASFQLEIHQRRGSLLSAEDLSLVVQWWLALGGMGARTRRGAGTISARVLHAWGGLEENQVLSMPDQLPSCVRVFLGQQAHKNAMAACADAVRVLQQFRQGVGAGRNRGSDPEKPALPGMSLWPEPHGLRQALNCSLPRHKAAPKAVNESSGHAPRLAFGAPIVMEFKDGPDGGVQPHRDPPKGEWLPFSESQGIAGRMASPLITKAVRCGDGSWRAALIVLDLARLEPHSSFLDERGYLKGASWSSAGHRPLTKVFPVWKPESHELGPWRSNALSSGVLPYPHPQSAVELFINHCCAFERFMPT